MMLLGINRVWVTGTSSLLCICILNDERMEHRDNFRMFRNVENYFGKTFIPNWYCWMLYYTVFIFPFSIYILISSMFWLLIRIWIWKDDDAKIISLRHSHRTLRSKDFFPYKHPFRTQSSIVSEAIKELHKSWNSNKLISLIYSLKKVQLL